MQGDLVIDGKNKKDLFCTNCTSKVLLSGSGNYTKCELELPTMTQIKGSTHVTTDRVMECFQVKDPFQFENVGFSKTVGNTKYLACADCELGPLGWQELPVGLCYVAFHRVRHGLSSDENAN